MVLTIEVDGVEELEDSLANTSEQLHNTSEAIALAVDAVLMPDLYARSISVWNVRTGMYSSSWFRQVESSDTVLVGNDAGYSAPLEYGWTTKAGTIVESEGVLIPSAEENLDIMMEVITQWLRL